MTNSFWWGCKGELRKGIHWLAWDKLIVRKEVGGMAFWDLHAFNVALLGKQGWKSLAHYKIFGTLSFQG